MKIFHNHTNKHIKNEESHKQNERYEVQKSPFRVVHDGLQKIEFQLKFKINNTKTITGWLSLYYKLKPFPLHIDFYTRGKISGFLPEQTENEPSTSEVKFQLIGDIFRMSFVSCQICNDSMWSVAEILFIILLNLAWQVAADM